MIKGMTDQAWFDLETQLNTCKTSYYIILWVKAILHNWDALVEILKTDKNMPQMDIDNIKKMSSYF